MSQNHPAYRLSENELRAALMETEREASKMQEAILFYFSEKFRTDATFTLSSMTATEAHLWSAAELTIHQFGNNE